MMYTKEKIIEKLIAELDDEIEGIIEYGHIYDSFIELGLYDDAQTVEGIAQDEYTHARVLWGILMEHGVDLDHHIKIKENWKTVKSMYNLE